MAKASNRLEPQRRRQWSAAATRNSDALDLERKVFAKRTSGEIARSFKRSHRRKTAPYPSAMSMLTFYIRACAKTSCGSAALPVHHTSSCWTARRAPELAAVKSGRPPKYKMAS
jgi:hypothetical protein